MGNYNSLCELGALVGGTALSLAILLTYVQASREDRQMIRYAVRHPREAIRFFRTNDDVNPENFPHAKRWGIISQYHSEPSQLDLF